MSLSVKSTGGAFSPVAMVVAVLVGLVAMAGLGVLSAYAPELRSGNDGGSHALSKASTGFGGLPPLLRSLGVPVMLSRGAVTEGAQGSLLVVTPTERTKPEQIGDIEHRGPMLIILPKWEAIPHQGKRGWVRVVTVGSAQDALTRLPAGVVKGARLVERKGKARVNLYRPNGSAFGAPVLIENLRTFSGEGWIPVVVDAQGAAILAMHVETHTYVLADPDFLSTDGLKTLPGARTAFDFLNLIRPGDTPIIFDLTLHGFQRSRNLLRLLLEPPLLGMTLAMVALAAMAGFQAAVRFGPPRETGRAIAIGKQALAQNTAGLVRLARREHHMAAPYALLIRAAVARAIGAPRNLDDEALNGFLDRVSRMMGASDTYTALANQARAARTPGDLMRVAGALYRWNQELTRARQ